MRFQKPYLAFPVSWIPFENLNNTFGLNQMYIYSMEKEMATHSIILVWEIPRTEESGGLQSRGSEELDMTQR